LAILWLLWLGSIAGAGRAHAAESDDRWAEALLRGMYDESLGLDQVESLFLEAIRGAANKAPIYVSLGDYCAGGRASKTLQVMGVAEGISEPKPESEARDESSNPSDVNVSDGKSNSAWDDLSESSKERLQRALETIKAPSKRALHYYLMATAEDPDYPIGWFSILTNGEGTTEQQQEAFENLKRLDPRNALPHYVRAVSLLGMEDCGSALRAVEDGNHAEVRVYGRPMPTDFSLVFPDIERFRELGLVGKQVPVALVKQAAESNGLAMFGWRTGVMRLAQRFDEEASRLVAEGETGRGVKLLEAVANMGLRMMRSDPPDLILGLTGSTIASMGMTKLRSLYAATGQEERLPKLDEFEKCRQRFRAEISAYVKSQPAMAEDETDLVGMAQQMEELSKQEKALIADVLKKTGLDTFTFDK
jgi:hypothetical protein